MVALTKKQFENRLLFLQKLYYGGYITKAERELPVIVVDNEFMVFEDKNGNITYDILEVI